MLLAAGATAGGLAVLWGAVYLSCTAARLPDPGRRASGRAALATVLYARGGQEIARYYRKNRTWTAYGHIAPSVRKALVATEDRRFYDHHGVDWRRLVSATVQTARGHRQGASTITMQLVRNRYAGVAASPPYERKVKELLLSLKLERAFSKRQILEAYLNTVSFGHGAFGIGAAARTYFDTTAAALGPAQAALLVGMLKGPTRYSPTRSPHRARRRRNLVLHRMQQHGVLSGSRARRLQAQPLLLDLSRPALAASPAPHFAEAVRRRVARWAGRHGYDLYTDGLRIHTTLDLAMQRQARDAVHTQVEKLAAVAGYEWSRRRPRLLSSSVAPYVRRAQGGAFEPFARLWQQRPGVARHYVRRTARYRRALRRDGSAPDSSAPDSSAVLRRLLADGAFMDSLRRAVARLDGGLVAVEPRTGAVRAYVGGRNFAADQYDKVSLARRQPGSTFKPFVWATALARGFAPYDVMRGDSLPDPFATPRRTGTGGLTLANGLAYSSNRMSLALTRAVGPSAVARTAHRLGIRSPLRAVPSLALGTSEVHLLEMANAYAALADGGTRHRPRLIGRIEDARGRLLERFAPRRERALSPHTTYTLLDLMRGVVDRGTGAPLRRDWAMQGADLAGKTGTTQNNADGWFLAMTPRLVAGAWTGFDDRRIAFRTEHWGHGSSNALRLVGAFLQKIWAAHPTWAEARFQPPPGYRAPRAPRPIDSLYAGYETSGDAYGADPSATDHRLRDAVGQGLDTTGLALRPHPGTAGSRRPRPVRAPRIAPPPTQRDAPAPVHAGDLDARIGTRRDTHDGPHSANDD